MIDVVEKEKSHPFTRWVVAIKANVECEFANFFFSLVVCHGAQKVAGGGADYQTLDDTAHLASEAAAKLEPSGQIASCAMYLFPLHLSIPKGGSW